MINGYLNEDIIWNIVEPNNTILGQECDYDSMYSEGPAIEQVRQTWKHPVSNFPFPVHHGVHHGVLMDISDISAT